MSWSDSDSAFAPELVLGKRAVPLADYTTLTAREDFLRDVLSWRHPERVVEIGTVDHGSIFDFLDPAGSDPAASDAAGSDSYNTPTDGIALLLQAEADSIDVLHVNGQSAQLELSSESSDWTRAMAPGSLVIVTGEARAPSPQDPIWTSQLGEQYPSLQLDFDQAVTLLAPRGVDGFESLLGRSIAPWIRRCYELHAEVASLSIETAKMEQMESDIAQLSSSLTRTREKLAQAREKLARGRERLDQKSRRIAELKSKLAEASRARGRRRIRLFKR